MVCTNCSKRLSPKAHLLTAHYGCLFSFLPTIVKTVVLLRDISGRLQTTSHIKNCSAKNLTALTKMTV